MGYSAKKLVGEYMNENGVFVEKSLSMMVFDGGKDAQGDGAPGKDAPVAAPSKPVVSPRKNGGKPRAAEQAKPPQDATMAPLPGDGNGAVPVSTTPEQEDFVTFIGSFGKRLLSALFGADRQFVQLARPTAPVPAEVVARHTALEKPQGLYTSQFEDETKTTSGDYVVGESASTEANLFFDAVKSLLKQSNAPRDITFHERVFGFTTGALLKIEKHLDFSTERGANSLKAALELLIEDGETVDVFVKKLATLLLKQEVRDYLLTGSRCFKAFDKAEFDKLSRLIGRAFCDQNADVSELGEPAEVGIVFTDIVNSTQLNVTVATTSTNW